MEIALKDKKLEELVKDPKSLSRVLGSRRAKILLHRLDDLKKASDKEEIVDYHG